MESESARMSSAAEAKFRIDRPNSQPRAVKVIALDAQSERIVKELAQAPWQRASFLTASAFSGAPRRGEPFSMGGWLNDLAGRTKDLVDEVNSADLVVMVATAGENAAAAAIIGEACGVKHVMTTALRPGSFPSPRVGGEVEGGKRPRGGGPLRDSELSKMSASSQLNSSLLSPAERPPHPSLSAHAGRGSRSPS